MSGPVTPLPGPAGPQVPRLGPASSPAETAREFEAVFLAQMTQLMLESVQPGEFSGGHGEAVFKGVLAEKLGAEIARRGGIGLAPAVFEQILKLQQGQQ